MEGGDFLAACGRVMDAGRARQGIGTLGEKSVHAVLKEYIDPRPLCHEVPVGPYVADVCNEEGFFEIQTRDFARLREKLDFLLEKAPVTVVYPVAGRKWVIWVEADGSLSPRRRSPKSPTAAAILPELYKLKAMLPKPGLRFWVTVLEVEDYRLKDGDGEDRKKGATKFDRLPVSLLDEVWLEEPRDFLKLVPESLPEEFGAREFSKAARMSLSGARAAVNVLRALDVLHLAGKKGRVYVYRRNPDLL